MKAMKNLNFGRVFMMVAFLAVGFSFLPACDSCKRAVPVAEGTPALVPEAFNEINTSMKAEQIIKILGAPARDVGSGLHILEWDVTDGTVFSITVADMCATPVSFGFRKFA